MPVTLTVKTCQHCKKSLDLIHFGIRTDSTDGFMHICRMCNRNRVAQWRKENHEHAKESQKTCYKAKSDYYKEKAKEARRKNPLKYKMIDAVKYSNNKARYNEYSKKSYKKNPKRALALSQIYRNKKSSKFCKQFLKETKLFYINCPDGMEVDHIIPISNKFVTGLHVPWNLQYLPEKVNRKKSNRFDGSYDNNSWKLQCQLV